MSTCLTADQPASDYFRIARDPPTIRWQSLLQADLNEAAKRRTLARGVESAFEAMS